MTNKTKKLLIILLDVTIGVIVELWASNSFPNYKSLLLILFFVFLFCRLLFDWFHDTVEDNFFQLELQRRQNELENDLEIQKEIKKQMIKAIASGDLSKFRDYQKIERNL